jgi:transcriptional regulator with XRE-family HTH domain
MKKTFGEKLRQLREDAKMNQEELAERAGTSRVTVARLETGARYPGWDMVRQLCKAIGVRCTEFEDCVGADQPEPPAKRGGGKK